MSPLISGQTLADVIAALDLGVANPGVDMDGGLRVGIHVQGFGGGGSESFVNGPETNPVPAPPALVLALVGLAGFGGVGLRRRLKGAPVAA